MTFGNQRINLKIFQIDPIHDEIKGEGFDRTVEIIKENHLKALRAKFENIENVEPHTVRSADEDFQYISYSFNQPKDQYYWKLFLPEYIIQDQDFEVTEFSYVLFILFNGKIYCVIGGSGMAVIKKYILPTFGIEIYKRFAKPTEDVVIEMNSRGIASNISQKKHIYNLDQTVSETLDYSEIPSKMKVILRKELKSNLFKAYKLDPGRSILEIGSYFNIRHPLSFDHLKMLIKDLSRLERSDEIQQLSLFYRVTDAEVIKLLDNTLKGRIIDEIISIKRVTEYTEKEQDVIEIVHPKKLEQFYDSDHFVIRKKHSRGKYDIEVIDRSSLYENCIKYIADHAETEDRFELTGELFKLQIVGYINNKDKTHGNFYSHVVAEVNVQHRKYFRIDDSWYYVRDEFLKRMTEDAVDYYNKYRLDSNILNRWARKESEDDYNVGHQKAGYYVLDKKFTDNIELCDILIVKDDQLLFVHAKDGFNTSLRECYIQIVLAAKRLSIDLKNYKGNRFLKTTLRYYNFRTPTHIINVDSVVDSVLKKQRSIVFVMAYRTKSYRELLPIERIRKSNSNIAKYSLVQVVKEMQSDFDIRLIDVTE